MEENKGGAGFVIGFLLGAAVGAAAALLMAPQSGEETRHAIAEQSAGLKDQATKQAQRLTADAKGQVQYVQEKGRVVISENVRKAQDLVGGGKTTDEEMLTPPAA